MKSHYPTGNLLRRISKQLGWGVLMIALFSVLTGCRTNTTIVTFNDRNGSAGRVRSPISVPIQLTETQHEAAQLGNLGLLEIGSESDPIAVQYEPCQDNELKGRLWWLMPAGGKGKRRFKVIVDYEGNEVGMMVRYDQNKQRMDIRDGEMPVLRYNYGTVPMPKLIKERFQQGRYPSPPHDPAGLDRGDYVHPLYGPNGEVLTNDYPVDHPHHRGIYWAWPEVYYKGEKRDIHAVYGVWARPEKVLRLINGSVFALIEVENTWKWKDKEPIVKEEVEIRAYKNIEGRRFVDFEFRFTGLADDVLIARRGQRNYGGVNLRMATGKDLKIKFFTDPPESDVRRAWADMVNTVPGGKGPTGVAVLQRVTNPHYPGDWVEYPHIFWYQPTFPCKGCKYHLEKNKTLVLNYRLWIRPGAAGDEVLADLWAAYNRDSSKEDGHQEKGKVK